MWKVVITHPPMPDETDDPHLSKLNYNIELPDAAAQDQIDKENERLLNEYNKTPISALRMNVYGLTGRGIRQGSVFTDFSKTTAGETTMFFATEAQAKRIEEAGREYYGLICNAHEV
jgi:hypothetical protein